MAKSLKLKTKVCVRKDLFGAHNSINEDEELSQALEHCSSPLKSIWGEGNTPNSQPPANSLLLSPALKRSPNRFNISKKNQKVTPKKKTSTPHKLSKYSPFRKKRKVYNADDSSSIKKFFPVKEQIHGQNGNVPTNRSSFGIEPLDVPTYAAHSCSQISVQSDQITSQLEQLKPSTFTGTITPKKSNGTQENKLSLTNTPNRAIEKINPLTPQSTNKQSQTPNSKRDIYAKFLLRIIFDIVLNDSEEGGTNLLDEEECSYVDLFNKLDVPSQRLYGRLLNRKIDWLRRDSMKYGDITLQLLLLEQKGFITADCSSEPLDVLLNLLTIPELKKLCKTYKLTENGNKSDIVSKLISRSKQRSIKSFFFQGSSDSDSDANLRNKIFEQLGDVIKVTKGPLQTFSRCLLFFSYPHFRGLERDRFTDQLALLGEFQNLSFPSYEVYRSKIFLSREQFLMYEAALFESSELLEAKENKDWETAIHKLRVISNKLEIYLNSEERWSEVEALPGFLRKFTPGGSYVRAISSSADVLRSKEPTLVEECLELLLKQRLFCCHHRGRWYEQLASLYQNNFKDTVEATEAVLRGLRDEYIDVVSRHTLCARAAMLEGRKKDGLKDCLKNALAIQRGMVEVLQEAPSITISEQAIQSSRPGARRVYVQDIEDGKMLSSVEEVVLEHFKQKGYIYGEHDEGGTIKSLIFACFWDEIYGEVVADGHGLFHSEFQTVPLDWDTDCFYERRRERLKSKLQDLAEGGVDAVIDIFQDCYVKNFNKESIVKWKYLRHVEVTESLIRCLEIDVFLKLSRLLLRHHRVYKSGFPDLTLWNPEDRKCIIVEVKSTNDHLSMKQRVWLHSLNKMGVSALVCHVQSVGCRGQRTRLSSPSPDF